MITSYTEKRAHIKEQIITHTEVLAEVYYELHQLISDKYDQLSDEVLQLAKKVDKNLSKTIINAYQIYVENFIIYTTPLIELDGYEQPLIPGLITFAVTNTNLSNDHPLSNQLSFPHYYAIPCTKPQIAPFSLLSLQMIQTTLDNLLINEHAIDYHQDTIPLARFYQKHLYKRYQTILATQHQLACLQEAYKRTYPQNSEQEVNHIINTVIHKYHQQQLRLKPWQTFNKVIDHFIEATKKIAQRYWLIPLMGGLTLLTCGILFGLGYPALLFSLNPLLNLIPLSSPLVSTLLSFILLTIKGCGIGLVLSEMIAFKNYKTRKIAKASVKQAKSLVEDQIFNTTDSQLCDLWVNEAEENHPLNLEGNFKSLNPSYNFNLFNTAKISNSLKEIDCEQDLFTQEMHNKRHAIV